MKLTSLKVAMCLSLLIHAGGLSVYYATRHQSNAARVDFQHERTLEIEIVSDPVPDAPGVPEPMAVKTVEIPAAMPPAAPPSLMPETKQTALDDATVFSVAEDQTLEVEVPRPPVSVKTETNATPQTVSLAAASRPAPEIDGDIAANYLLNPKPVYPPTACQRKEEGLVILAVEVDREGFPNGIQIIQSSSFQLLDEAAVQAVSRWRFSPARLGNRAVASRIEVPIRFKLTDSK